VRAGIDVSQLPLGVTRILLPRRPMLHLSRSVTISVIVGLLVIPWLVAFFLDLNLNGYCIAVAAGGALILALGYVIEHGPPVEIRIAVSTVMIEKLRIKGTGRAARYIPINLPRSAICNVFYSSAAQATVIRAIGEEPIEIALGYDESVHLALTELLARQIPAGPSTVLSKPESSV
jgi:hypothetical protein